MVDFRSTLPDQEQSTRQQKQVADGKSMAQHDAQREDVQRQFVHHRGLRVGGSLSALPGHRCATVEVGCDAGQDHHRRADRYHRGSTEMFEGAQPALLGHRGTDRGTEQVGVQEVADLGG